MYKPLVLLCVVFCVIEARPKWQFLPPKPGYVPVYIRAGDTPLEEINPDLAMAFHAWPAGRSAGKELEASPEDPADQDRDTGKELEASPEDPADQQRDRPEVPQADQPQPDIPGRADDKQPKTPDTPDSVDHRPYEKKFLERKTKKASLEIVKAG